LLNNQVNTKRILLDERVEMKVALNPQSESIIYCRPFEEDIHNVSAFNVHGQEFVHNYTTGSDGHKYIITNVITEDGDVYEDVKFKLVIIEAGTLPLCVANLSSIKDTKPLVEESVAQPIADNHINNKVFQEKVTEYKHDLLAEFLTFSQTQQKNISESLTELKESVEQYTIDTVSATLKNAITDILQSNINIANTLTEKFEQHSLSLEKATTAMKDEAIEEVNNKLSYYEKNFIEDIKPHLEKATADIISEKFETIERLLSLDKRMDALINENTVLQTTVTQLAGERQVLKTLVESSKQYTDAQISRYSQDAKDYARRILELGSGGGSVAVQYVGGGTMYGDLDIRGNILSGGNNLVNVFAGEGGGDDNPINGGIY
jgi:hypothetical protein